MDWNIEVVEMPAMPALTMRRHSAVQNLPAVLGEAYGKIMQYACSKGFNMPGPAFVVYYNMDMSDLDIEVGFVAGGAVEGNEAISGSEIPAGPYVTAMHIGPYEAMAPLYEAMSAFILEKGLTASGIAVELYYNSPAEVPEAQLKTKVMLALTP